MFLTTPVWNRPFTSLKLGGGKRKESWFENQTYQVFIDVLICCPSLGPLPVALSNCIFIVFTSFTGGQVNKTHSVSCQKSILNR